MRNWKFHVGAENEKKTSRETGPQIRDARWPTPWCDLHAEPARVQRVRAPTRLLIENDVERYSYPHPHGSAAQEQKNELPRTAGWAEANEFHNEDVHTQLLTRLQVGPACGRTRVLSAVGLRRAQNSFRAPLKMGFQLPQHRNVFQRSAIAASTLRRMTLQSRKCIAEDHVHISTRPSDERRLIPSLRRWQDRRHFRRGGGHPAAKPHSRARAANVHIPPRLRDYR